MSDLVTRADVQLIADRLKEYRSIKGIELFGSILRNGVGHDADLILLVDSNVSQAWWTDMRMNLLVKMGTWLQPLRKFIKRFLPRLDANSMRSRKKLRLAYAGELLGIDFDQVAAGKQLDIFLMPPDWRVGHKLSPWLSDSVTALDHAKTRSFIETLARTAETIA